MPIAEFSEVQSLKQLNVPNICKLALFTSYSGVFSKTIMNFMLILSQLQILLIILKPTALSIERESLPSSGLTGGLYDTFFFEDLQTLNRSGDNMVLILILITVYLSLNIFCLSYLIEVMRRKKLPKKELLNVWSILVSLHHYIFFYPIHVYCVKVISILFQNEEEVTFTGAVSEKFIKIAIFTFLVASATWSVSTVLLLKINIKTKDPLSTKTTIPTMLDLVFKVIMPFIEAFTYNSEYYTLVLLTANLVYCLTRDSIFLYFLPYYDLSNLRISALSNSVLTSCAFATFTSRVVSQARSYPESDILIPIWGFFFLFILKLYMGSLNQTILRIIETPDKVTNPYHLMHYLKIYKTFTKNSVVSSSTAKAKENYLRYMAILKKMELAYLLPTDSNQKLDHKAQYFINKHFVNISLDLLHKCIKKNPNLLLLKATIANYYTKYKKLYVLANQILDENLSSSILLRNSFFAIKLNILQNLKAKEYNQLDIRNSGTSLLALEQYIQVQQIYRDLKKNIVRQIRCQTEYWKLFNSSGSAFVSLVNLAKSISKKSVQIKKSSINYKIFQEHHFSEPLLMYSLYFYFAQNDVLNGKKFIDGYSKLEAHKKQIVEPDESTLQITNVDKSIYLILSATGDKPGIILNCSGQANKVFGIPKQMLLKHQLSVLMPQLFGKWYEEFIRNTIRSSESKLLDQIIEVPILMKNGFIVSHWIFLRLTYLREFGLCYSGLIAPFPDEKRVIIIITEDGQICNFSREFAQDMNITEERRKRVDSIYSFCPNLKEVIENLKNSKTMAFQNLISNKEEADQEIDNNDVGGQIIERQVSNKPEEDSFLEGIHLAFSPYSSNQDIFKRSPTKFESQDISVYKAKITMRVIRNLRLFEISMEKIDSYIEDISPLIQIKKRSISVNTPKLDKKKSLYGGERETTFQISEVPSKLEENDKTPVSKYGSSGFEDQEPLSTKRILKKKENIEINKKYTPALETNNETSTNPMFLLTSPKSEKKILIPNARGDDEDFEIMSDDRDISKLINPLNIHKQKKDLEHYHSISDLKKIEASLSKEVLGNRDDSSSFGMGQEMDIYHITRKVVASKRYQNSSIVYNLSFIVTICTLMAFLIWLNFNTAKTSTMVGTLSQVIQNAYFRSFWLKISVNDMMFWVGAKGTWLEMDPGFIQGTFTQDYFRLNGFNQNLRTYLNLLDVDIQEPFYRKDVYVYERDSLDNLKLVTVENSFELTERIVSYGIKNGNKNNDVLLDTDFVDYDTKFIFDNSLNSLMIVSERLTADVEVIQSETLNSSKHLMLLGFSVTLAILILFIVVSLVFVIYLNKYTRDFMRMLSTLPVQEVKKIENSLSMLIDVLEKDANSTEMLGALNLNDECATIVKRDKENRKVTEKVSMKTFYARNYLTFFGLFVCLGFVIAFMIIYYNLALDKILLMESQHTNLNSALNVLNKFAYIIPGLQVMTIMNATTTIKDIPVMEYMKSNLNKINRVSDLQANLRDFNGELSSYQKEILFQYSCTKAYSPLWAWSLEVMQPECEFISEGLNFVSLLKLITHLETLVRDFLEAFESAPKDLPDLKSKFFDVLGLSNTTDISFILLLQLFADSSQNFHDLVVELEDQRIVLAWVACLVSVTLGTITWVFIVRRLCLKEFQRKKLLALIPNRLILENFLLKQYIKKLR